MGAASIAVISDDPAWAERCMELLLAAGDVHPEVADPASLATDPGRHHAIVADGRLGAAAAGMVELMLAAPGNAVPLGLIEPRPGSHNTVLGRIACCCLSGAPSAPLMARLLDDLLPGRAGPLADLLLGASPALLAARRLLERVAATDATVLLNGESGTGKDIAARGLHQLSARAAGPFVPLNCAAVPPELLESELFGHEKGAFTGAISARAGRFEMANGGTLFLDEVGDMPPAMQVKLLRVLETRSFERVGGNVTRSADVRIVAATHRDLDAMVAAGSFRADLFFRLNVIPIVLPPLRERAGDIVLLAQWLAAEQARRGLDVNLAPSALQQLAAHAWPGNVRELANVIERLAVLHAGEPIEATHVRQRLAPHGAPVAPPASAPPADGWHPASSPSLPEYLDRLEAGAIATALESAAGVTARAAELLGVGRTTLVEKMRRLVRQGLLQADSPAAPSNGARRITGAPACRVTA